MLTALGAASMVVMPGAAPGRSARLEIGLRDLERRSGGRLGVAVLDTADGSVMGNRLDEHFALCSTFKALAVAFVLARVDRGVERLDRRIVFTRQDLVAPFKATEPHVGPAGMSVEALCDVAVTVSDSTAANLLLRSFGGPAALTAFLRENGDAETRLDREELSLNIVRPGEVHDTTTPRAMVQTLQRLLLGDVLSVASRVLLTGWMLAARDAATRRLRVGLPQGWRIANKPGTWEGIATNDIGVIWPPGRPPVVVAAYLGGAPIATQAQEAILADVARLVAAIIQGG